MLTTSQSKRQKMIHVLMKYGACTAEVLAGLSDQQIEDIAGRLKHCVVVTDTGSYRVEGLPGA